MGQLTRLLAVLTVILSLTGCGWLWGKNGYFRDRSNDYLKEKQAPLIKIPPQLKSNSRPLDPLYVIPANVATSHAGSDFEVPRPIPLQVVSGNRQAFSMQRKGGSEWFIAQKTPSQIYPAVLQYFREAGFHIETDAPQIGEFVTTWTTLNSLSGMLSGRLSAVDSSLKNKQFRVRVRVLPGVQTDTSEVSTLTVTRPENSTATIAWPAASQNMATESVLLDELIANMSNTQSTDRTVSLLADKQEANRDAVFITRNAQKQPILTINGDFDIVWSRIERAITAADIKIDDMDRSTGVYYINLAENATTSNPGFIRRLLSGGESKEAIDARAERYMVKVSKTNSTVQVSILNNQGTVASGDKVDLILKRIKDNMD